MPAFSLDVMTFNLRRRKASDGPNTWVERRAAAAEVIRKYAPAVVGTQEGLEDQVEDLLGALPGYAMLGEARFGGRTDEFNAIFYRKDLVSPVEEGNFWLSDTPHVAGSRTWGNLVPRMATWARFQHRATKETFRVINTHFDHLVPSARRKAAKLVSKRMPDDGSENVLLMGDFNAFPHGGTYRWLTADKRGPGMVDSLRIAEMWAPQRWSATFHNFTGRGLYRIDYVFVKALKRAAQELTAQDARARVRRHAVVRDTPHGKFPSDHFPVLASLDLPMAA